MLYRDVINFWFAEITPEQWWKKDEDLDRAIKERFSELHTRANACELYEWRNEPLGRVAEIIVLDQFSRNIYRGTPLSFASDTMALCLSQEAIRTGDDLKLSNTERCFGYMPFMHSESQRIHRVAVALFSNLDLETNLNFELKHKEVIDRFGRYPHRNDILGRPSTADELEFLKLPGSTF